MKKLLIPCVAVLIAMFAFGCASIQAPTTVFTQECTIYQEVGATPENSIICAKISNPCAVHKMLAIAAKAPVIWKQQGYVDLFDKWAARIQTVIESGVSYQMLQEIVLTQIAKINKEAGLALLLVSDGIFVFDQQTEMIAPIDKKLLLMSLADLRAQVKRMAIIAT